jgi:hypothetical protein
MFRRTSVGIAWRRVLSSCVGTCRGRRSWMTAARSSIHCASKGGAMAGARPRMPTMVALSEPREVILMWMVLPICSRSGRVFHSINISEGPLDKHRLASE